MKSFILTLTVFCTLSTAIAAESTPATYPLTTCVISGEALNSMGGPFVFTHEGTEVRLCCEHCKPKFEAKPADYLKKIEAARADSAVKPAE